MIVSMLSLQRRKILIDSEIRKEPSDDRRLFHLFLVEVRIWFIAIDLSLPGAD